MPCDCGCKTCTLEKPLPRETVTLPNGKKATSVYPECHPKFVGGPYNMEGSETLRAESLATLKKL